MANITVNGQLKWMHEIGQSVDHLLGGMPCKITNRSLSAKGLQIYTLQDGGRERYILGDYLVAAAEVAA